jgi:hypothetical protein
MKYTVISLFISLLFIQGCGGDKHESSAKNSMPADSILSRDRMIQLLTDVQIAEGALLHNRNLGKERLANVEFYYAGIFHKYRISRSCYLANLKHYQQDPAGFVKIYNAVVQKITEREKNYDPKGRSKLGVNSDRID